MAGQYRRSPSVLLVFADWPCEPLKSLKKNSFLELHVRKSHLAPVSGHHAPGFRPTPTRARAASRSVFAKWHASHRPCSFVSSSAPPSAKGMTWSRCVATRTRFAFLQSAHSGSRANSRARARCNARPVNRRVGLPFAHGFDQSTPCVFAPVRFGLWIGARVAMKENASDLSAAGTNSTGVERRRQPKFVAPQQGLEPRPAVLETTVLPLHHCDAYQRPAINPGGLCDVSRSGLARGNAPDELWRFAYPVSPSRCGTLVSMSTRRNFRAHAAESVPRRHVRSANQARDRPQRGLLSSSFGRRRNSL